MKKTLVFILALAGGVACGLEESQVLKDVTTVTSSANSFDFTNTSKGVTIALTLDVAAYKNITDNQNLFKLNGTWEDDKEGYLGINSIVGGSNPVKDGIQSSWTYGTNAQNQKSDINQYTCFSEVDWTQVVGMTMVMSYDEGADNNTPNDTTDDTQMPFNTAISVLLTNGKVLTWAQEKNNLFIFSVKDKNGTVTGKTNSFTATNVTANATYVDSLTVYSDYLTKDESIALSKGRLIPEPTTATLSLLALAGLAARRRRK